MTMTEHVVDRQGGGVLATLRAMSRTREGKIGGALAALILLVVVVGPYVAPSDPLALGSGGPFQGMSADHPMGTDQLGRDVFSRLLSGGRNIIAFALAGTALAFLVGGMMGMLAGYKAGTFDLIATRVFDLILAFPQLLLILILVAGLGAEPATIIAIIALVYVPRAGLAVRAATRTVAKEDYVLAARARGESLRWILGRELLPNVAGPILAEFALRLTYAIIFVSVLSYLGLGTQPPAPDWGLMIAEAQNALTLNPAAVLGPAACLAILAVSVNLLADAMTSVVERGDHR